MGTSSNFGADSATKINCSQVFPGQPILTVVWFDGVSPTDVNLTLTDPSQPDCYYMECHILGCEVKKTPECDSRALYTVCEAPVGGILKKTIG
jgi:hypothetical protein